MRIVFAAAAAFAILLAACGGGSSATPVPTVARTDIANLPAPAPSGAIAVTEYHLFPTVTLNNTLVTLPLTATVPSGYKTTWYTYTSGAWKALDPAPVVGGLQPAAQTVFAPVPENIIVFAEPQ